MLDRVKLLSVLHILNDGYQASFLLLLPFIAKDLNINLTQIGTLGTFLYGFEIIFALPAGYLNERLNGLKVLILSMALYGLSYLLLTFSPSFIFLILIFSLAGIGFAIFHPIAFALLAKWSHKDTLGRSMGDFMALGDLGRIGLSTVIAFLAVQIGWRSASFLYSLVIFLFFMLAFSFLRKKSPEKNQAHKDSQAKVSYLQLLKNKKFVFATIAGLFDCAASTSLFVFLPFLLISKHINPAILGLFTGAYFVGNLIGKTTIGRLSDKLGSAKMFIYAEIFMALFIFLLTMTSSMVLIIIFSIILGALTKGTSPARTTMAIEATSHHKTYEKSISLFAFIATFGTAASPLLYGRIGDVFGITTAFYAAAGVALLAALPAAAFIFTKNDADR